jgi:hypothetical protein
MDSDNVSEPGDYTMYALYAFVFYIVLEVIFILFNAFSKDCTTGYMRILPINMLIYDEKGKGKCSETSTEGSVLNKYRKYATEGSDCLYDVQIDRAVNDIKKDEIVEGYTAGQLLGYVIVPLLTVLSLMYWGVTTRSNKAEWTFWILISSLLVSGLTSAIYQSDVILESSAQSGSSSSPLSYITNKLELGPADVLNYRFVAQKQDDSSCTIEGSILGMGTSPEGLDPMYTPYEGPNSVNSMAKCSASELPLY